jgi:hypothetical protein
MNTLDDEELLKKNNSFLISSAIFLISLPKKLIEKTPLDVIET